MIHVHCAIDVLTKRRAFCRLSRLVEEVVETVLCGHDPRRN